VIVRNEVVVVPFDVSALAVVDTDHFLRVVVYDLVLHLHTHFYLHDHVESQKVNEVACVQRAANAKDLVGAWLASPFFR